MPVYSGGTKLYEIKAGSTPITEVYAGATKVFPEAAPTVSITMSPASVSTGGVLTFTATAAGSTTLAYAWYFNGSVIGGQTGSTYARTTVAGDNGDVITCRVTDLYGQTTTSNGQTMVVAGTLSATNPGNKSAANGATAVFSTTASGGLPPYTYQWQRNNANIGGATAASYTTPALDYAANNGDTYRCIVRDSTATPQQVTTANGTLTVTVPALTASITPTSFSGIEGDVIPFVATAGGGYGAKTYQWQLNNANIGGATGATYNRTTVLADNGKNIRCVIGDAAGQSTASAACVMTIAAPQLNLYDTIVALGPYVWYKMNNNGVTENIGEAPGIAHPIFAGFSPLGDGTPINGYVTSNCTASTTTGWASSNYTVEPSLVEGQCVSGCMLIRPTQLTGTSYYSYADNQQQNRNMNNALGWQAFPDRTKWVPFRGTANVGVEGVVLSPNTDYFVSFSQPASGAGAGELKLFINGVKTSVATNAYTISAASKINLGYGKRSGGGLNNPGVPGNYGPMAIFNRELSDAEHLELYAASQVAP